MANALLKGTYADLDGNELTPGGGGGGGGGSVTVGWVTNTLTAATNGRYFRTSSSLIKLADGRFFIVGGEIGSQTESEIINATATASTASGTTTNNRTAGVRYILLNNGDVLVAGGNASPTTSETWNSGTGLFTARGACTHIEDGGIAALDNGNAVVFGGINGGLILNTTQIYDAAGFTWSASGNMVAARTGFGKSFRVTGGTIGKVFVAGGTTTGGTQVATTEMFDGDTGLWTAKASMSVARGDSCNIKLPNGNIMVAGGVNNFGNTKLSSVEIYNPTGDSWSTVGSLNYARQGAHGVALADGRVIVAGGLAPGGDDVNLPTEIYDPVTAKWSVLCGPLNYTPALPSDPLHQVYGASLAQLNGSDGLESIIAVGGKAAAPNDFPSTSARDIRQLLTLPSNLVTLKNAYDNQGSQPFIIGTSVFQSMSAAKVWTIKSPEPTFTPLLSVYSDATLDPTYGAGVEVGGTTFRSTATKNVFNGPVTFGSQTFSVTANTDTIPSDKQIVRLISTIGNVTLTGTPVIAAGLFEGQRLITVIDADSDGSFTFANGTGRGIQPSKSPTTLTYNSGIDRQEALEWVWTDGFWKTVSAPAIGSSAGIVWTEALHDTGVNATVYAASFTPTMGSNSDAVLKALGTGATLAQVPDGTATSGDKRGNRATDFQKLRSASTQVASGANSFIGAGQNNTAAGDFCSILSGSDNATTGIFGTVLGGAYGTDRGVDARLVWSAGDNLPGNVLGSHQMATQITKATTNGTLPTPLVTDGGGILTATNANSIPANVAYKVRAEVVAIDETTGDTKAWTLECLADNSGIIGTPPGPVVVGDSGVAWTATLAWDGLNVAIYVEATGAGSNDIHWTSTMWTTEVGF